MMIFQGLIRKVYIRRFKYDYRFFSLRRSYTMKILLFIATIKISFTCIVLYFIISFLWNLFESYEIFEKLDIFMDFLDSFN